jgi:thiol:disulfide interchange protein
MKITILVTLLLLTISGFSQSLIYNPNEDAKFSLDSCISKAKKENKHVLVQIGGNWCKWCIEFHRFAKADSKIDSILRTDFVYYLLNYSKENKNLDLLSKLGFPQRFGFPVFVVINGDGVRLHTQNSSYLEDGGKSYDAKKTIEFLQQWSFDSMDPKNY